MIRFEPDTIETRYQYTQLARHIFILKLLKEIRADIMICELEGWDKTEFIELLYKELANFKKEIINERIKR